MNFASERLGIRRRRRGNSMLSLRLSQLCVPFASKRLQQKEGCLDPHRRGALVPIARPSGLSRAARRTIGEMGKADGVSMLISVIAGRCSLQNRPNPAPDLKVCTARRARISRNPCWASSPMCPTLEYVCEPPLTRAARIERSTQAGVLRRRHCAVLRSARRFLIQTPMGRVERAVSFATEKALGES